MSDGVYVGHVSGAAVYLRPIGPTQQRYTSLETFLRTCRQAKGKPVYLTPAQHEHLRKACSAIGFQLGYAEPGSRKHRFH